MKIAYFDCFAGISGDMCLGALLDAGLKIDYLNQELAKLDLSGYTLQYQKVVKHGLSGTKLDVLIKTDSQHLSYKEMISLIQKSSLIEEVKTKSLIVLGRIAEAEAKAHNLSFHPQAVDNNQIHFHELGELDTLIDVVGTVIGLSALGIQGIYSSALNLGEGNVQTQHGLLPVPAPATAELIKGVPCYSSGIVAEITTPTGAAIITTLANSFGSLPRMRIKRIGYGAGSRELQVPNLLRIMLGSDEQGYEQDIVTLIETNIDDSNPQVFDYLMDRLFKEGALDVYLTNIQMKKNRPAVLLSVLASQDKVDSLINIILKETPSIGVRYCQMGRKKLSRQYRSIKTKYGEVKVKIAATDGYKKIMPEYEDCKRIANEKGVPLLEIYNEVRGNRLSR